MDTVEADDGRPLLLELEMLDPVLFFDTDPAARGSVSPRCWRDFGLREQGASVVPGGEGQACVSATAASGSITRKVKLSSR